MDSDVDNNECSLQQIFEHFPVEMAAIPDIFANLYTGNGSSSRRIGYIRLNAEDVLSWDKTPRWMHFKALDTRKDSPGSVLINLQFYINSENTKRLFKQMGFSHKFILYAHIIQGFELDPKVEDEAYESRVMVEIGDADPGFTKASDGRYPFFNEQIKIPAELDNKLDFAPDLLITVRRVNKKTLFGTEQSLIGKIAIPVRTIKKLKTYPHYFNVIKNNEKNGRLLAMFYIKEVGKNGEQEFEFPLWKELEQEVRAKVSVSMLGIRDMDFFSDVRKLSYQISIAGHEKIIDEQIYTEPFDYNTENLLRMKKEMLKI